MRGKHAPYGLPESDVLPLCIYLDTGIPGLVTLPRLEQTEAMFCYSEALLMDLKNDPTGQKWRDMDLLNGLGAMYLFRTEEGVALRQADAREEFGRVDRAGIGFMAPMYRYFNGGGPDHGFRDAADLQLRALMRMLEGDLAAGLTGLPDFDLSQLGEGSAIGPVREVERGIDRLAGRLAGLKPRDAEDFLSVFPSRPEGFDQLVASAMMLGAIGLTRETGIRARDDAASLRSAERGVIDCHHIAYALHCNLFLTTDRASAVRFSLLSEYWGLHKRVHLLGEAGPGKSGAGQGPGTEKGAR